MSELLPEASGYAELLELSTEEFNMGWVARYTSPDTGGERSVGDVRRGHPPRTRTISVHTEDVDGAYDEARRREALVAELHASGFER